MMNNDLTRIFVGYDKVAAKLAALAETTKQIQNYPPFNIKKVDENKYALELAIAGFSRQDIDIELVDGTLVISAQAIEDTSEYVWKGISNKAFTRQFTLADNTEVKEAKFANGLLTIILESVSPKQNKQKVDIK
jgi:molecular chaperone IbpA